MGSQPKTQTTTENKTPWAPAQAGLQDIMTQAKSLYDSGAGYTPWQGNFNADLSSQTQGAMNSITSQAQGDIANGGSALGKAAYSGATNLINNNGITDDMRAALGTLQSTSNGDYVNKENPYLAGLLNTSDQNIMGNVSSLMSGAGRYGSGSMGNALGNQMATARNNTLYQNYNNERQNQLGAAGQLASIYGQGADRAMAVGSNGQALENLRYDPQSRLGSVGQFYDQRAQNELDNNIQRWDDTQNAPWQRLGAYNAIMAPMGAQGGTVISTSPVQQKSKLTGALGGAMAGGSMFGPFGAIGGGILGALG